MITTLLLSWIINKRFIQKSVIIGGMLKSHEFLNFIWMKEICKEDEDILNRSND